MTTSASTRQDEVEQAFLVGATDLRSVPPPKMAVATARVQPAIHRMTGILAILVVLLVTRYRLLYDDWRGFLVSFFSLVFVANVYLAAYARLRVDITSEKAAAEEKQRQKELAELKIDALRRATAVDAEGRT